MAAATLATTDVVYFSGVRTPPLSSSNSSKKEEESEQEQGGTGKFLKTKGTSHDLLLLLLNEGSWAMYEKAIEVAQARAFALAFLCSTAIC